MLNLYGTWSGMACTAGQDNEPSGSLKRTEILDQSFGPYVFKKDAAPWSKGEHIPVHATKACGVEEERCHSFLRSAQFGASGRSALRPGHLSPNEEAQTYPLDRKLRRLQRLSCRFGGITNRYPCRK